LKARTGAQTLAVRPVHPVDLPRVKSIVDGLALAPAEIQNTTVTAAVADPAVLPAAVRRLDDAGVLIAELNLHSASLDEVFLTLTGHRTAAEQTETEQPQEVPA
jgi:oleandomycin transport system ATP-binding protein